MGVDLEIVFVFKNEKDKALMERFLALDAFEHPKKYEEDEMLYRLDFGFNFRSNRRNEKPYVKRYLDYVSDLDRGNFGSYFISCSIDKDICGHERRFAKDIAYLYNTFFSRYVKLYLIEAGSVRIYEYEDECDVSSFSFNDVQKLFDMLDSI